jgi:hypothetical protein
MIRYPPPQAPVIAPQSAGNAALALSFRQVTARAGAGMGEERTARGRAARWWRSWRSRFGLAEVCGTAGAAAGFAAGYLPGGSLLAGAGLATLGEWAGFYGCVGTRAGLGAARATAHLAGGRRLAAGAWHAVRAQLGSCAAAEALDFWLIRPGCLAGAGWLLRSLPAGAWLGLAAGKAVADVIWYAVEAAARRGLSPSAPA